MLEIWGATVSNMRASWLAMGVGCSSPASLYSMLDQRGCLPFTHVASSPPRQIQSSVYTIDIRSYFGSVV